MRLDTIQSNLYSIILGLPFLAPYVANGALTKPVMVIDDGDQFATMDEMLAGRENDASYAEGMAILLMPPQCVKVLSQGRRVSSLEYSATIWLRTNPKIKTSNAPKWNPLTIEHAIIPAVLTWIPGSNPGQIPFKITEGLEPETDFTDVGNNSRLIRFTTEIIYSQSTQ
jgi:hypothetical protein